MDEDSTPQRTAWKAEDIREALIGDQLRKIFIRGDISGKLNLEGLAVDGTVVFEDCFFEDVIDASYARFRGTLTFRGCIFKKSLTLRGATIDGALDVSHSKIYLPDPKNEFPGQVVDDLPPDRQTYLYEPPPAWRSAKWNGLTVFGDLKAHLLKVQGSLNVGNANIEGNLLLQGCEIGWSGETPGIDAEGRGETGHPKEGIGGRLYLRQSRINGDVEMSPWMNPMISKRAGKEERFSVQESEIHGSLSVGSSIITGRFNLRGIVIHECLHAIMARISGRVLADCWIHPDDSYGRSARRTRIGVLRNSKVIEFDAEAEKKISVYFHDTRIEAAVWLRGLRATGAVVFENARIEGALQLDVWNQWRNTRALTDADPWSMHMDKGGPEGPVYRTEIGADNHGEGLKLSNATIAANVDLKGLRSAGRIVCHNTNIGGSFLCKPYQITELRTLIQPCIGHNLEGKSLSLYGAKVGVNVDFSGARFTGAVRMRYATVSGAVIGSRTEPKIGTEKILSKRFRPVTEIGASAKGHGLYLYGAKIRGNVCCNDIITAGCISLELAEVTGYAEFKRAAIATRPCREEGPQLEDGVLLIEDGDVQLEEEKVLPIGLLFRRATITNDFDISKARIWAGVDGTGVTIGGNLRSDATQVYAWDPRDPRVGEGNENEMSEEGKKLRDQETLNRLLLGKFLLFGGVVGCDWSAQGLHTTDTFSVKGLRVGGNLNLTKAYLICHKDREPVLDYDTEGLRKVRMKHISFPPRSEDANFPGMVVGADCILDGLIVRGRLNLSQCRIQGALKLSITSSLEGSEEIDLSHTSVGTLQIKGGNGEPDNGCKLNGLTFKHADLEHLEIESLPSARLPGRKAIHAWPTWWKMARAMRLEWAAFLFLFAHLSFASFIAALFFLACGIDPLGHYGESLKLLYAHIRLPWESDIFKGIVFLFWLCFYLLAIWVCRGFYQRALGILSPIYKRGAWEGQTGDKAAAFIALSRKFSQGPYIAFRRAFESEGQKEDGAQLYFRMREREVGIGCDQRHSHFTMLFKWIFFVASGSGVKTKRLCGFLILYFCFSWFAVFSNPDSVEHPSTFTADKVTDKSSEEWKARTGRGYGSSWQQREEQREQWPFSHDPEQTDEGAEQWNLGDGFWMALKVHVPLLHLWAKSKWEPASAAGWYYSPFGMRPMWYGMEYETYAVIAQIVSYLLIPMLLTALVNAFLKGHESVEHEHKHAAGHGH